MSRQLDYYRGAAGQVLTLSNYPNNDKLDSLGWRMYDTVRIKAGQPISTSEFFFFTTPVGQLQGGLNFTTQYVKTLQDTNMRSASQLPKDHFFAIQSMQIALTTTGSTDAAYGASGPGTELPTDPTDTAAVAAENLEQALLKASFYTFRVGTKDYEEATGDLFPSSYGISGFAGAGATETFSSVSNNGFGRPYIFPIPRYVDSLRNFSVRGQFAYSLTPTRNVQIRCILEGLLFRPVQ